MPITLSPGEARELNVELTAYYPYPIWHIADQKTAVAWNASRLTVARPNNVLAGDLLVALVSTDFSHILNAPSGFRLIRMEAYDPTFPEIVHNPASYSYYKIATGAEPSSYTFSVPPVEHTADTLNSGFVLMGRVTGFDPVSPIGNQSGTHETTWVESITIPGVTASTDHSLLIAFTSHFWNVTNLVIPAGMYGLSIVQRSGRAQQNLLGGGSTGTRRFSWSTAHRASAQMFDIRPEY